MGIEEFFQQTVLGHWISTWQKPKKKEEQRWNFISYYIQKLTQNVS